MSRSGHIKVDPDGYKLNGKFFRRMWHLWRPYWTRSGAWRSWISMGFILATVPTFGALGVYLSRVTRDETNALVARQEGAFWHLLIFLGLMGLGRVGMSAITQLVEMKLYLHWRKWLTNHLINSYLARRTYFEITIDQSVDNPDQRIQQEVEPFCQTMCMFPRTVLGSFVDVSLQLAVLWGISPPMAYGVGAFAFVKTVVIFFLYKPTIKYNYDITVSEADFRYGLLHVRDNAESVAFYRGEESEKGHIAERLGLVIRRKLRLGYYTAGLSLISGTSFVLWEFVPFLFLAPLFFRHVIPYGTITQGAFAGRTILQGLSLFLDFIPLLSSTSPHITRLSEIYEKYDSLGQSQQKDSHPRIAILEGPVVRMDNVHLLTPNGETELVKNFSLEINQGEHLVIVGQTGVGKSSLLRAAAGLWTRGTGSITMPAPGRVLFLPQRPYMILANLRDQFLYPLNRTDVSDEDIELAAEKVGLGAILKKHGGLTADKEWGRILSLGEQQRIGFARVILAKPDYVFVDEATSALDMTTEAKLYSLLLQSGSTIVSVGHRPTIIRYHRLALKLHTEGAWEVIPIEELGASYKREMAAADAGPRP